MAPEAALRRPFSLPRPSTGWLTFAVLNAVGLVAYLHPFLFASATRRDGQWFEHSTDAPLVFGALGFLCLGLVVAELSDGRLNSKSLAALGVLAAMSAVLRTITLPAGANLFWLLLILGSYTFGPRLGFLLGALSMFLSAIVTGGMGPWLPFQAFAAAWLGMAAGLMPLAIGRLPVRAQVVCLAAFGAAAAIFYGLIINLWSWPFWAAGPDISYAPGLGTPETIRRYLNFYLLTSFGWDLMGSVCNVVSIATLGGPLLRALLRFHDRFEWSDEQ